MYGNSNNQKIGDNSTNNQQANTIYNNYKNENENENEKDKTFSILGKVIGALFNQIENNMMLESRYEHKFKVKNKIEFNNLKVFNDTIYDWLCFMNHINMFYGKDIFVTSMKLKIFNSNIKNKYKNELINLNIDHSQIEIIKTNSDNIFKNVKNQLLQDIKNDNEIQKIDKEYIESSLDIILVKAFIDCNILENPNGEV